MFDKPLFDKTLFDKTIRDENIFSKDFLITAKVADTAFRMKINDAKHANIDGQETVLDKQIIDNLLNKLVDCFKKNNSKYLPFPKNVDILVNANENNGSSQDTNTKNQEEILEIRTPRFSMNDIYVPEDIKEEIGTALTILEHKNKLFEEWKLGDGYTGKQALVMNFYGPPGTGKSMICEAIASYLGKKIFIVNYAQLESKYVGETPKNIKKVFELANKEGAVLLFDEADSFLSKRLTSITQAADYGVNITRSVMLIELEKFDGIAVFTTNLISNYDEAFKRRILLSIEFRLPDENGRAFIWDKYIQPGLPVNDCIDAQYLAKRYSDLSGADIKDAALYAAVSALRRDAVNTKVLVEDFDKAVNVIKNRYAGGQQITQVMHERVTQEQYDKEMAALS